MSRVESRGQQSRQLETLINFDTDAAKSFPGSYVSATQNSIAVDELLVISQ